MRCSPAIGVDDNFAASQTSVTIGPANDKDPRRVHPPFGGLSDPIRWQHLAYIGLDNGANIIAGLADIGVLG